MLEEKIKLLSPNIKAVVEHVLKNKIVSVYNSANIPLTGTNEDTIDIIRSQIAAFQEYKEAHPELKVSISSWAKQKQIYKITMVGREVMIWLLRILICKTERLSPGSSSLISIQLSLQWSISKISTSTGLMKDTSM